MSEFIDAIKSGDIARINEMLDRDPSLLDAQSGTVTPILAAIYHGHREIARLLVERGARVSFAEACALGDAGRVEWIATNDPDALNRFSADGFPPLGLAIFFGHSALARRLIELGADVRAHAQNAQRVAPVHAAAAVCDRETMRMLLARGADPNALQQADYTPLHGAASRGDVEMAQLLLDHGADRLAKAANGQTIADAARSHGHPAFAEWVEGL